MTYHAVGINGADVPAWLRCHHLPGDLKLIRPDSSLFSASVPTTPMSSTKIPSEQFKARYRELIACSNHQNRIAPCFRDQQRLPAQPRKRHSKPNPNGTRGQGIQRTGQPRTGGGVGPYRIMRRFALFRLVARQDVDAPRPYTLHRRGCQSWRNMLIRNAIITDCLLADGN